MERVHHRDEDISFKLSPYKNRVSVAEAYQSSIGYRALNQAQPSMRNEGQKKTLQKVLNKLNMMNAKLNVDSLPSIDDLQGGQSNYNPLMSTNPSYAPNQLKKTQKSIGSQSSAAQNSLTKPRSHKRSSSMGNSFRNFSNKSGAAQIRDVPEGAPIVYDGKEINTIHDLIANFKLDNYQEAMRKREDQVNDPDNPMPAAKDVDEAYWDMI
mmetsp:Transcript_16066/g.20356  ORF Transcript_16066/g.20356 Transcript_16066/m.20356 type:complete len:210 (-) Transcript_16066:230-859(-)